uniref:Uncharacterized protein n=1 Tax=Echeneis naucrates TaxID=173247 RepID=A0A665T392_ECHNA
MPFYLFLLLGEKQIHAKLRLTCHTHCYVFDTLRVKGRDLCATCSSCRIQV